MLRKLTGIGLAIALGAGAALGIPACGEDRGSVQIEGGTGTSKTGAAETSTVETSKTQKTSP